MSLIQIRIDDYEGGKSIIQIMDQDERTINNEKYGEIDFISSIQKQTYIFSERLKTLI